MRCAHHQCPPLRTAHPAERQCEQSLSPGFGHSFSVDADCGVSLDLQLLSGRIGPD
jgi:hypothetical protein